jgi:mRNA interferase RelE/StbE
VRRELILLPTAEEQLAELPPRVQRRVVAQLERLASHPNGGNTRALTGRLKGITRLRVGDYRVAFQLDEGSHEILVVSIGHRRKFYDDLERRQADT